MRILGFNFDKISIERLVEEDKGKNKQKKPDEGIKIDTKIDISDIEKTKIDILKGKDEVVVVKFTYIIEYNPSIAIVEFKGNIILTIEPQLSKELFKQWKDKKIPDELRVPIFNTIFRRSNLKALQLEEELNLPSHIPMPRLSSEPSTQQ